jgi:shikimate kinase
MKNIILIGMMGCGKTSVGRLLAQDLGRELVDTDALIEAREGRTIPDIFAAEGEGYFRDLESELCRELSQPRGLVIACGGGLPLCPERMASLKQGGLAFWLKRDPLATYDSLDLSGRPLAQEGRESFLARYAQRAPVYRGWADYIIEHPPTAEAAAHAITYILKEEEAL